MRAGLLDRTITIERVSNGTSDSGAVAETWSPLVTLRAQLVQSGTEEFQRAFGASSETAVIFRTRYVAGITLADRVSYGSAVHNIVEIKEIGRRRGLELRCRRVGP
jgi:SPP1 family predicted phage head-tail adaptor